MVRLLVMPNPGLQQLMSSRAAGSIVILMELNARGKNREEMAFCDGYS